MQTTLEPDNKLEFSRGIKDLSQSWLYLAFTTTAYKNTDMQKQQSFRDIHRPTGEESAFKTRKKNLKFTMERGI